MSKALGMRCVWGLCGVLASALVHTPMARADVSTDISGSVLVFPKVLWTGSTGHDTIIQVTNTSNLDRIAHCFYVNAREVQGRPLWQVTDFTLMLTKKHPTHWTASRGRRVNPLDSCLGSRSWPYKDDCDGAGIDPGAIPPVPPGFIGELKCVEVDVNGLPMPSNSLKGEAVLRNYTGDVSKYNAYAIAANMDLVGESMNDGELRLDNTPTNDGEYNSCAAAILLNHFADGLQNPAVEQFDTDCAGNGDCAPIRTELTLVPCSQDFENLIPSRVTLQILAVNEFEEPASGSFTVDCWYNKRLADIDVGQGRCTGDDTRICTSDQQCISADKGFCRKNSIFSPGMRGSTTFFSTFTPVSGGGVLAVAEEIHHLRLDGNSNGSIYLSGRGAWNPQQAGTRFDAMRDQDGIDAANENADTITIPTRF
jgi:hypothetical protein